MANVAKYTREACGHLFKHFERAKDEHGEYIRFGNQGIDTSRSHLNYNLAPERESQYQFLRDRTKEVRCLDRADVKVMCSWVVTAPKGLQEDEHERFFRTAYKALVGKYGEENVISAWVHQDEAGQPHLHFAFVPVVQDKKRGGEKVSAKELLTKAELKQFHPWLTDVMQQEFGYDVGVETGELGTRGNLTMQQYQAVQDATAAAEVARQELEDLLEEKATQEAQIEAIQQELPEVERTNAAIRAVQDLVVSMEEGTRKLRATSPREILLSYMEEIRQPFTGKPTGDYRITGEQLDKLSNKLADAVRLTHQQYHPGRFSEKAHTEPSLIEKWASEARSALVEAYNTVSGSISSRFKQQLEAAERAKESLERRLQAAERKIQDLTSRFGRVEAERDHMREFLDQYTINGRSMLEVFEERSRVSERQQDKHQEQKRSDPDDLSL